MQCQFIGKASAYTGLSVDTIRLYEKVGLIEHPARTKGKFRTFEDVHQLRVIRRLIDLGFSLSEMKQVFWLQHRNRNIEACTAVRDLLRKKLVKVRGKIRILRLLEQELQRTRGR